MPQIGGEPQNIYINMCLMLILGKVRLSKGYKCLVGIIPRKDRRLIFNLK